MAPGTDFAWKVLLAARRMVRESAQVEPGGYRLGHLDRLEPVAGDDPRAVLAWGRRAHWVLARRFPQVSQDLFDLYLSCCSAQAGRPITIGHLGQSLDGQIATAAGDSCFVTGPENIVHLHRMRALSDAVIVGAGTVAADDPRLTTRQVAGAHPVRVVVDPRARLARHHRVFTDGCAPTILVCAETLAARTDGRFGQAEVWGVPCHDGELDLRALLAGLGRRGLHAVFVEGGGVTVSRFLEAALLDRLQVTVAPVVIGPGRPGVRLPPVPCLRDCFRPRHRLFRMGEDVLFDCDLRVAPKTRDPSPAGECDLSRVL